MRKKDLIQFFVWMRNGTAFCISWFLLLLVIAHSLSHTESISTLALAKMMLLSAGGVLLFCIFFTRLFLRRWQFLPRLTCCILSVGIYECAGLYWLGVFRGSGGIIPWVIFASILFLLYLLCIGIYQIYSRKKGRLYTQALQKYQQSRREETGE